MKLIIGLGIPVIAIQGYRLTGYLPETSEASQAPVRSVDFESKPPPKPKGPSPEDRARWAQQRDIATQDWGRDPFARTINVPIEESDASPTSEPANDATPELPADFTFTGVSRSDGLWLAAVGGDVVRVGDRVRGQYRVVRITRHSVALEADGWTYLWILGEKKPKVRPASEAQ